MPTRTPPHTMKRTDTRSVVHEWLQLSSEAVDASLITSGGNAVFCLRCRKPLVLQLVNQFATRERRVLQVIRSAQSGLFVPIGILSINAVLSLRCRKPLVLQLVNQPATRERRVLQVIRSAQSGLFVPIGILSINAVLSLRCRKPLVLQLFDQPATGERRVVEVVRC